MLAIVVNARQMVVPRNVCYVKGAMFLALIAKVYSHCLHVCLARLMGRLECYDLTRLLFEKQIRWALDRQEWNGIRWKL